LVRGLSSCERICVTVLTMSQHILFTELRLPARGGGRGGRWLCWHVRKPAELQMVLMSSTWIAPNQLRHDRLAA
jgi:hypothetical protein